MLMMCRASLVTNGFDKNCLVQLNKYSNLALLFSLLSYIHSLWGCTSFQNLLVSYEFEIFYNFCLIDSTEVANPFNNNFQVKL